MTATLAQTSAAMHDALLVTVDALSRRRACDVTETTIDRLVALRWLRWSGGSLRLTEAGEAMVVTLHASTLDDQRLAA